ENHPRVLSGIQVLDDVTRGEKPSFGQNVAVIGGGNVAMDAARTARRLGCDVAIYYRRREEDMPADEEEVHEAKAEHIDLITQAIPISVRDAKEGRVTLVWGKARMVDKGPGKRPEPVLIEDEIFEVTVDSIVSAIGQDADYSFLPESFLGKVRIERGKVVIDRFGRTGDPKVFAGGDIANNTRDAISAIANGHEAAKGIDWMLNPQTTPR
ncbi:MAG TPA: FAD-dependent oxidoreductase, partial [Spirochaetia bacterium]|nr:FAD-dependent oxidoreductase [Spirochaetia bacterium]